MQNVIVTKNFMGQIILSLKSTVTSGTVTVWPSLLFATRTLVQLRCSLVAVALLVVCLSVNLFINGQRYVAFGVKDSLSEILKMCQDIFTLSTENYKKSLA